MSQPSKFNPFALAGLTEIILMFLDVFDVTEVRRVNKQWQHLSLKAQAKVFKNFEEKNHSFHFRGKWIGGGYVFHVKCSLALIYPKKEKKADEEEEEQLIPSTIPVNGAFRWKLVKKSMSGRVINFKRLKLNGSKENFVHQLVL